MRKGKKLQELFKGVFWGFFLGLALVFGGGLISSAPVFAEPTVDSNEEAVEATEEAESATENTEGADDASGTENTESEESENTEEETEESATTTSTSETTDNCQDNLGSIGWIVCPTTGKVAEAVDWLYDKIEGVLAIDPVEAEDGQPIYEIWKYCRSITNIVFIIFMLVAIYSQLTGVGLSNYGLKRSLPKLIIAAILVNLSFLICSLAVDASNIIGAGLRGVFENVEEMVVANMNLGTDFQVSELEVYSALIGGTALTIGGAVIAFETGAIWMLIPVLLGAIVAVATGLITIALRQAVVALLIMISPLAFVCYILPNTEKWFRQWKNLLFQMLVFYPAFSLLFGASQLAGFAIILSASDGFFVLLGIAVQIFPLFFSWKLMKMSGNFLGTINGAMNRIAMGPLAMNRAWADSHRMLSKQRHLASGRAATPSLRLMQFVNNRRIGREADIADQQNLAKTRALARRAERHYNRKGESSRNGMQAYRDQKDMLVYQQIIKQDEDNMNAGLTVFAGNKNVKGVKWAKLAKLDNEMVEASDNLKFELARGEYIEYENAKGFHTRVENAMNAGMDAMMSRDEEGYLLKNGKLLLDKDGQKIKYSDYKFHADLDEGAGDRYKKIRKIAGSVAIGEEDGNRVVTQYIAATAARGYDTQKKIVENTYQKYFEMLPPTKDIEYRLGELTKMKGAADYIDAIMPGLRVINQRGDTDIVREHLNYLLMGGNRADKMRDLGQQIEQIKANRNLSEGEMNRQIQTLLGSVKDGPDSGYGVELGTHASQELASFLMHETKGGDPALRRFGKYLNLETARVYNKNDRKEMKVTYDEYVRGYHIEPDGTQMKAKKGMKELLEGTSYDDVERTAFANQEKAIREAYTDVTGKLDWEGYKKKREEVDHAILPQLESATMKYQSGSEAIQSLVQYITGLNGKGEEVWRDKNYFEGHEDEAAQFYQDSTKQFIKAQTISQLINQRSDFKSSYEEQLLNSFLSRDDDELTDVEREKKREYNEKLAEIQTRDRSGMTSEEARKNYEKERYEYRKQIRSEVAPREYQRLIGPVKLQQLRRTVQKSSAGASAKDWTREWITADFSDGRSWAPKKEALDTDSGTTEGAASTYTERDREMFIANIERIWEGAQDDKEAFYDETSEYLGEQLGNGSYIVKIYERYYKKNPDANVDDLKKFLDDTLGDENNY